MAGSAHAHPYPESARRPGLHHHPGALGRGHRARRRGRVRPSRHLRRRSGRIRRRDRRGRGPDRRQGRAPPPAPCPRPVAAAGVRHQCRPRQPGPVRLAAARRDAAQQQRHPRDQGGRVRPDGGADAGQQHPRHGHRPARRRVAQALGPQRGRGAADGDRPRRARGGGGEPGRAARDGGHRRARPPRPASRPAPAWSAPTPWIRCCRKAPS